MIPRLLLPLLTFVVGFLLWFAAALWLSREKPELSPFIPGPQRVANTLLELILEKDFWGSFFASNSRVVLSFFLSIGVAVPVGSLLGASRRFRILFSPSLDFSRYVPVAALVPLSIIWIGVGDSQKVSILFIGTCLPLLIMIADAVRRIPASHVETARIFGLSKFERLLRVQLPSASPEIFDSMRVAMGLAWSYLLVAEIVASERGLGYAMIRAQRFLQMERILALILVLGVLGLAYDRLFVIARPALFPWASQSNED